MNSLFPIYHYSQFFSPFQNLADNNKNENENDNSNVIYLNYNNYKFYLWEMHL